MPGVQLENLLDGEIALQVVDEDGFARARSRAEVAACLRNSSPSRGFDLGAHEEVQGDVEGSGEEMRTAEEGSIFPASYLLMAWALTLGLMRSASARMESPARLRASRSLWPNMTDVPSFVNLRLTEYEFPM